MTLERLNNLGRPPLLDDMLAVSLQRDRDCFGRLFLELAPRLKAYLMRQGASPEAAEDIAQETLIVVWRKADQFDPNRASPAAWIFTIARNLNIDAMRREGRPGARAVPADGDLADDKTPEDAFVSRERAMEIRAALDTLPDEQALQMSYFLERPHADIAEQLHLPLGTVKSRLRLAMARLRETVARA